MPAAVALRADMAHAQMHVRSMQSRVSRVFSLLFLLVLEPLVTCRVNQSKFLYTLFYEIHNAVDIKLLRPIYLTIQIEA